jgi:alkanesulfonate monooxygenase SsuD/methylene tetrahydromethanopterin reductase-like flavin-dependent oxidoreductase (luciferase family)
VRDDEVVVVIRRVFTRNRDGSVDVALGEVEVNAVDQTAAELIKELSDPGENSARWFPPAYADDPQHQQEFARMTRDDLIEHKNAAAKTVVDSIREGAIKKGIWRARLTEEQAHAWLGALNDARLLLGTKLNVTEEMEHLPRAGHDPEVLRYNVYAFLSALQGLLVEELLDSIPARGDR